ncbi:hypothetical protein BKI52_06850 [marine bacterium AO1-C]|nr:hypothetical protein BKI52_06850 [marine bacterium AO1-C]
MKQDNIFTEPLNIQSFTYDFKEQDEFPQALAQCTNLTRLQLRNCPEELTLPSFLGDLPHLNSIDIAAEKQVHTLPKVLFDLPVTTLEIRRVALEQIVHFKQLTSLIIVTADPFKEIDFVAQHFPQLTKLKVWGRHLAAGALPPSIQQFFQLEELQLISCGLAHLPVELAQVQSLKKLILGGLPMNYFPEVITQLSNLEVLDFRQQVKSLPESLTNLTQLKKLNLYNSLWGYLGGLDDMDSMFDDPKTKALPAFFGKLISLESLDLGYCAIHNVEPLTQLPYLKHLALASTFIPDLQDVAKITQLESLNLESCDKVRNISHLASLKSLKTLNVSRLYRLKSIQVIEELPLLEKLDISGSDSLQDLGFIYQHPTLTHLEADEKILENWKNKDTLETPQDKDSIVRLIESNQLSEAQQGINALLVYLEQNSSEDDSPLPEIFTMESEDGYYDEEGMANLPQIEAMIEQFKDELTNEDYLKIFKACYQNIHHNFQPAIDACEVLIQRNAVESQKEMVTHFLGLMEYYDGGHRFWGSTTLDCLIDDYLEGFAPEALALLLENCSTDNLNATGGDGMDELYVAAFNRVKDPETLQSLLASFITYFEEMSEYEADYFTETLPITRLLENSSAEVKEGLSSLIEQQGKLESIIQALESGENDQITQVIADLKENIDLKSHEKIEDFILKALEKNPVSASTTFSYFTFRLDQNLNFGHYRFGDIGYRLATTQAADLQNWLNDHQAEKNNVALKSLLSSVIREAYLKNNDELLASLRALRKPLSTQDEQKDINKDLSRLLKYLESNGRGYKPPTVLSHFHYLNDAEGKVMSGYEASSVVRTIIDAVIGWSQNDNNTDYEQDLIQNIPNFDKLEVKSKYRQQLLIEVLKAVMNRQSTLHLSVLIEQLPVPGDVVSKEMALQVARFYTWQEDKAQTIVYLQKAVKLGVSVTDITEDSAFEKYASDKEFLASLEVDPSEQEVEQLFLELLDQTMDRGEDSTIMKQHLQGFLDFLPRLESLTTPILLDDLNTKHLYNVTVNSIHSGLSQSLTNLTQYLPKLSVGTHWLGEMLGNLLHAIAVTNDWEKLDMLKKLLPSPFKNARLAFNMACCYALNQQKPEMLEMANLAIKLGKDKAQFLSEGDFKNYWSDAEFLEAIEG